MQKSLPKGWKWVRLGEVVRVDKGRKMELLDSYEEKSTPYIGINNLRTNQYTSFTKDTTGLLCSETDLLIAWDGANAGTIGYGLRGYVGSTIARLRPSESITKYLGLLLKSKFQQFNVQTHGAAIPHLSKTLLLKTLIPLPPLPTQHKIVEILENVGNLRNLRQQADEKMKDLIPSLFVQMFGDPVKNEKKWNIVKLEEILRGIDSGWSPVCDQTARSSTGEWAVLTLGAVTSCYFKPIENKLLPSHLAIKKQIEVRKGDVLLSRKNTKALVGSCVYVFNTPPNLMMSDTIFRLDYRNDKTCGQYLWSLLIETNVRKSIQALANGSAGSMPNISKQRLMKFTIPLPPLSLQQDFAKLVEDVETEKARQTESKKNLDELFNSLMQRAFSGEVVA